LLSLAITQCAASYLGSRPRVTMAGIACVATMATGQVGSLGAVTYSKSAVAGLSRQMAVEFGERGIRFNAVAPSLILTPAHTVQRQMDNPSFYDMHTVSVTDDAAIRQNGSARR